MNLLSRTLLLLTADLKPGQAWETLLLTSQLTFLPSSFLMTAPFPTQTLDRHSKQDHVLAQALWCMPVILALSGNGGRRIRS